MSAVMFLTKYECGVFRISFGFSFGNFVVVVLSYGNKDGYMLRYILNVLLGINFRVIAFPNGLLRYQTIFDIEANHIF